MHGFANRPAKAWCLAKSHQFLIGRCQGFLASICEWPLGAQTTQSQKVMHKEVRRTHASNHCKGPHRTAISIADHNHGSQKRLRAARRVALAFSSAELALRRLSPEPLTKQSLPQSQKMSLPVCQQNCHIVVHFRPNRLQRGAAYTDNPLQLHVSTLTCIDVLALDEVTDSAISSSSTACFSARALHQSWASRLAFTKTD